MDDVEQQRIEKDLRKRLAKPKYPPIFYLPQAYEVHSPEPVPVADNGNPRCTSVGRSERDLGGNRGGMGGVVREPVSCALEAGHGGPHKTRSFPIPASKMQSHWEWSDLLPSESRGDSAPEDAARMGAAAIASFSGRVFDGNNQGLPGMGSPSQPPFAELWRHAGVRFRVASVGGAVFLIAGMVLLGLFLNTPRWQFAAALGVAYGIAAFAGVQAGMAMGDYQRLLRTAVGGHLSASETISDN